MMKKTLFIAVIAAMMLAGCKKEVVKVAEITFTQTSVSVEAGKTVDLAITVKPVNAANKSVTWSSSNTSVATVADGVVTAVSAGTATITASAADGSGVTATCTITVTPAFVAVTNITGVPTAASTGVPLTLSGTVNPDNATNKTIVWSVANAGTTGANISGNTLTTTAAGTVTVRATIANGATATTNYTQEFSIAVTTIFVAVTNITGVQTTATASTPLALSGTVEPANATNKTITWSVVNAGTTGATISGTNTLNTTSVGTVRVRATIVNGLTATTNYTKDFDIVVSPLILNNVSLPPLTYTPSVPVLSGSSTWISRPQNHAIDLSRIKTTISSATLTFTTMGTVRLIPADGSPAFDMSTGVSGFATDIAKFGRNINKADGVAPDDVIAGNIATYDYYVYNQLASSNIYATEGVYTLVIPVHYVDAGTVPGSFNATCVITINKPDYSGFVANIKPNTTIYDWNAHGQAKSVWIYGNQNGGATSSITQDLNSLYLDHGKSPVAPPDHGKLVFALNTMQINNDYHPYWSTYSGGFFGGANNIVNGNQKPTAPDFSGATGTTAAATTVTMNFGSTSMGAGYKMTQMNGTLLWAGGTAGDKKRWTDGIVLDVYYNLFNNPANMIYMETIRVYPGSSIANGNISLKAAGPLTINTENNDKVPMSSYFNVLDHGGAIVVYDYITAGGTSQYAERFGTALATSFKPNFSDIYWTVPGIYFEPTGTAADLLNFSVEEYIGNEGLPNEVRTNKYTVSYNRAAGSDWEGNEVDISVNVYVIDKVSAQFNATFAVPTTNVPAVALKKTITVKIRKVPRPL